MRYFLKRTLVFATVLAAVSISLNFLFPSRPYWGNREYEKKTNFFKKGNYNTVFFGSSRILSGINPLKFDSLANLSSTANSKSFNLATAGTWSNETFYLYDQFLSDTTLSANVQTVFIEFQNIMAIRFDKIATPKVVYYQNFDNLTFITSYALEELNATVSNLPTSLLFVFAYSIATAENLLNIGRINLNTTPFDSLSFYATDSRGYLPLETKASSRKKISEKTLNTYIENITNSLKIEDYERNEAFHKKINDLITRSKLRGIDVIFILPPVKLTPGMMSVFYAIPAKNKIQVCDPATFPELYNIDHWIDETHLTKEGSSYLTNHVCSQFVKSREYASKMFLEIK
jgi:hypothetical protein